MESVGQQLRGARLRLGLTLEDISSSTRIHIKKITGIETDELSEFSSRFLYKAFARQVAAAVKFSSATFESDIAALAEQIPAPLVPGQVMAAELSKVASLRPARIRISRWISSVALLVLILAACSSLFAMWQSSRNRAEASAQVTAPLKSDRSVSIQVSAAATPAFP